MTAPTTTTTPIIVVKDEESFRRVVGVVSFVLGLGNVVATKRLSVGDYIIITHMKSCIIAYCTLIPLSH